MKKSFLFSFILSILIGSVSIQDAYSHCDTKSGPVISAAKEAIKTGNVNLVLIWVKPDAEEIIKKAFKNTLDVRKTNPKVQELADNYFFETLVRIHRQGEGAPYTGIKEDTEIEPPIQASDKALESSSDSDVLKLLNQHIQVGVSVKFNNMITAKNFDKNNVGAGREFVEKYVTFMHYVEGIYNAASKLPAHSVEHSQADGHGNVKHENGTVSQAVHSTSEHDTTGHLLIIGATVLVVAVQIITSKRRKV
ncbi:MAG: hypothetical protein EPN82_02625 [Bacteroidetes bacterium]|nr:MAG: hypothetical protein EPN82_02625 [Bacteroidota bacterium]